MQLSCSVDLTFVCGCVQCEFTYTPPCAAETVKGLYRQGDIDKVLKILQPGETLIAIWRNQDEIQSKMWCQPSNAEFAMPCCWLHFIIFAPCMWPAVCTSQCARTARLDRIVTVLTDQRVVTFVRPAAREPNAPPAGSRLAL